MHDSITHVGLDVHSATIEVAIAEQRGDVRRFGRIANRPTAVRKLVKKLSGDGRVLCFWYEAGPTGYGLYRQLIGLGHDCHVVAPSLVPRKPGDRVKTDRRDALLLARCGRGGDLTSVWVPGEQQEAMRDLTRCREDAKAMERVAKQQLGAFLLRHGRHYAQGRQKWTKTYFNWLADQKFDLPAQQIVFQEYVNTLETATARVEQLTSQLETEVRGWSLWPMVQALRALRGVDLITAATVLAELGDVTRFDSPRQLMAFLGLVPSENTSGPRRRQGGITKTGNSHVRRVLVEAGWTYRHPARMTKHMRAKVRDASPAVQKISWKAQKRLCGRYRHLINRGKLKVQTCVAVARELSGFIWAIAHQVAKEVDMDKPLAGAVTGSRLAEPSSTL